MGNEENLRALLAEAHGTLRDFAENWDCDSDAHKYGATCRVCDAETMKKRIDAAFAEPVGPERSPLAVGQGTWSVFAEKVVRERDEARAEVERLKESNRLLRHDADKEWGAAATAIAAAYQRGAEAMREKAARVVEDADDGVSLQCLADAGIREMPLPEDKS